MTIPTLLHIQPLPDNSIPLRLEQEEIPQAAAGQVDQISNSHRLLVTIFFPPMETHPKLQPGVHTKRRRQVHTLVLPRSTRLLIGGGVD
jgi:hypothetical protein